MLIFLFGFGFTLASFCMFGCWILLRMYRACSLRNKIKERRAEVIHYALIDKAERERKKAQAQEMVLLESGHTDCNKEVTDTPLL